MFLKNFEKLPDVFKNDDVYTYYLELKKKRLSLVIKRLFDFFVSLIMLLVISPILIIIAILIKFDSNGPALFKQERVTRYAKPFRIYKFRTMYCGSEKGSQVTLNDDERITRIGKVLRKYRLDELPQLVNILKGEMSFVGTRPEVKKYVNCYSDKMYATLLMPAGVTSLASIKYKDEDKLLLSSSDTDLTYINEILPEKMKYNLDYILQFSVWNDFILMISTVFAVLRKENSSSEKSIDESKVMIER